MQKHANDSRESRRVLNSTMLPASYSWNPLCLLYPDSCTTTNTVTSLASRQKAHSAHSLTRVGSKSGRDWLSAPYWSGTNVMTRVKQVYNSKQCLPYKKRQIKAFSRSVWSNRRIVKMMAENQRCLQDIKLCNVIQDDYLNSPLYAAFMLGGPAEFAAGLENIQDHQYQQTETTFTKIRDFLMTHMKENELELIRREHTGNLTNEVLEPQGVKESDCVFWFDDLIGRGQDDEGEYFLVDLLPNTRITKTDSPAFANKELLFNEIQDLKVVFGSGWAYVSEHCMPYENHNGTVNIPMYFTDGECTSGNMYVTRSRDLLQKTRNATDHHIFRVQQSLERVAKSQWPWQTFRWSDFKQTIEKHTNNTYSFIMSNTDDDAEGSETQSAVASITALTQRDIPFLRQFKLNDKIIEEINEMSIEAAVAVSHYMFYLSKDAAPTSTKTDEIKIYRNKLSDLIWIIATFGTQHSDKHEIIERYMPSQNGTKANIERSKIKEIFKIQFYQMIDLWADKDIDTSVDDFEKWRNFLKSGTFSCDREIKARKDNDTATNAHTLLMPHNSAAAESEKTPGAAMHFCPVEGMVNFFEFGSFACNEDKTTENTTGYTATSAEFNTTRTNATHEVGFADLTHPSADDDGNISFKVNNYGMVPLSYTSRPNNLVLEYGNTAVADEKKEWNIFDLMVHRFFENAREDTLFERGWKLIFNSDEFQNAFYEHQIQGDNLFRVSDQNPVPDFLQDAFERMRIWVDNVNFNIQLLMFVLMILFLEKIGALSLLGRIVWHIIPKGITITDVKSTIPKSDRNKLRQQVEKTMQESLSMLSENAVAKNLVAERFAADLERIFGPLQFKKEEIQFQTALILIKFTEQQQKVLNLLLTDIFKAYQQTESDESDILDAGRDYMLPGVKTTYWPLDDRGDSAPANAQVLNAPATPTLKKMEMERLEQLDIELQKQREAAQRVNRQNSVPPAATVPQAPEMPTREETEIERSNRIIDEITQKRIAERLARRQAMDKQKLQYPA